MAGETTSGLKLLLCSDNGALEARCDQRNYQHQDLREAAKSEVLTSGP